MQGRYVNSEATTRQTAELQEVLALRATKLAITKATFRLSANAMPETPFRT